MREKLLKSVCNDLLYSFKTIQNIIPKPYSGAERLINKQVVTHYDPESQNLWESIEKFKRYVGI